MAERAKIEKFSASELASLRLELSKAAFDNWEAADILCDFLTGRGYGVSNQQVRDVLMRVDGGARNFEGMQEELEKVAYVM